MAMAEADAWAALRPRATIEALGRAATPPRHARGHGRARGRTTARRAARARRTDRLLRGDHEIPALLHALDGALRAPGAGGDLLRTPDILPTGRNLHGFDPFRIPSAFAVHDGARAGRRGCSRATSRDGDALPETVALVLWGTDNLKTEGGPIAQALALIGATPRFDGYGRLCGAELIPLDELGRPRIDVVMTLSGIFRDLLPLQTRLLAEAALARRQRRRAARR